MIRLLPSTLFGRLVVVLLVGLLLAQLAGAAILLRDRSVALFETGGLFVAQRITGIVRVLDILEPEQRQMALRALAGPNLRVAIERDPEPLPPDESWQAARIKTMLAFHLGAERSIRVTVAEAPANMENAPHPMHAQPPRWRDDAERYPPRGDRFRGQMPPDARFRDTPPFADAPRRMQPPGMDRPRDWLAMPKNSTISAQVQLADGAWALVEHGIRPEQLSSTYRLLLTLAVLLIPVIALSLFAVRRVTRPLAALGNAAEELGKDINRPPLEETGPEEVKRAAQAFNAMQLRLQRYLKERTELLAAISHDLKTPITRLRLRAEMIEDEQLRAKLLDDIAEMDGMTRTALDFMRSTHAGERVQPLDVNALVESLQADFEAMGHTVELKGTASAPLDGRPLALRRALTNLIDNAIKYGQRASVTVADSAKEIRLAVADEGPGIPEHELGRVLDPFYRVEPSRNRETGGVGLGLSIARDIALAHNGKLVLRNRPGGGLEACLILPRDGVK
ncbi:MAG: ATP-binding protein [Gallionella sp.]|nr:ATP-binding protein [Gallionella sp.]